LTPVAAFGRGNVSGAIDTAGALLAHGHRIDFEEETFVVAEASPPLSAANHHADHVGREDQIILFDTTQITSDKNYSNPKPGDPCHPLAAGAHPPAIAFDARQNDVLVYGDKAGPLDTARPQQAVAIQERATAENPDVGPDGVGASEDGSAYTLEARPVPQAVAVRTNQTGTNGAGFAEDGSAHALDTSSPQAVAVSLRGRDGGATAEVEREDVSPAIRASQGGGDKQHVLAGIGHNQPPSIPDMMVRRITPLEAERLQGFPDLHTLVEFRSKPMKDGPRYRMLGNSMAVNCMRWIGERIDLFEKEAA